MFQSIIPVTFGILFTPWNLAPLDVFAVVLALASGGFVYLMLKRSNKMQAWHLMVGGSVPPGVRGGAAAGGLVTRGEREDRRET